MFLKFKDNEDDISKRFDQIENVLKNSVDSTENLKIAADNLRESVERIHTVKEDVDEVANHVSRARKVATKLEAHSTSWLRALRKSGRVARTTIRSVQKTGENVASRIEEAAQTASKQLSTDFERYHATLKTDQDAVLERYGTIKEGNENIGTNTERIDQLLEKLFEMNQWSAENQQAIDERLNHFCKESKALSAKIEDLNNNRYRSRKKRSFFGSLLGIGKDVEPSPRAPSLYANIQSKKSVSENEIHLHKNDSLGAQPEQKEDHDLEQAK
jgi:hypothetical protein